MNEMKIFIYGSLSEGLVHFSRIKDFIADSVPAHIKGTAYRLKVGYPVILAEGNDLIPGFLVQLKPSAPAELLFSLLDEFHGCNRHDESKSLYFRQEMNIQIANGFTKAFVYVLNPARLPRNSSRIEGGNWLESLEKRPPLTAGLTERQKAYIQRLGSCTGREIVPIDLSLYRELMNLELIVDKGRRLALSKLGQEVFTYL
jgi:gamma-glutamylcyclotransferase (GGCT)/AIG2-like uncharacterized protein YtfP